MRQPNDERVGGRQGYALFLREFFRNFHTTGAVLPSGTGLASALTKILRTESGGPRRILEVGPGTGAVTAHIARSMREGDMLDIVEINESFVATLRERFLREEAFRTVSGKTRILHADIVSLPRDQTYDIIISGLPLNNFPARTVENILDMLTGLLSKDGTLSYFEYAWIRRIKGWMGMKRLREIGAVLNKLTEKHDVRRELILLNVPPAWAHHIRRTSAEHRM